MRLHALSLPRSLLFLVLPFVQNVLAEVTIYTLLPGMTPTSTAAAAGFTGAAAYDPTRLTAPQPPGGNTKFTVQIPQGGLPGLSIGHNGAFMGFSIEISVAGQIFGKNGSFINPPFLNLLGNIRARAGRVNIRFGGNTQDKLIFQDELLNGALTNKTAVSGTVTPDLEMSMEMLYTMANISSLTNAQWIVGYPFANVTPPTTSIVQASEEVLGQYLLGIQLGNEPDRYPTTGNRGTDYDPQGYSDDFGNVVKALGGVQGGTQAQYIGGNLCCNWTPEQLWDTGFLNTYKSNLRAVAMQHYPKTNCNGDLVPQDVFAFYLNHDAAISYIQPYINTAQLANAAGLPFYITETNTASCSGFRGISNSFGAALWGIDHALNMAAHNLSGGFFHIGGQNAFYNPFTPPPTNQSTIRQWTVGAVYYSSLITAEVFGSSNASQIVDLAPNDNNTFTPGYAVYENGVAQRVALFNFVSDPSGASDITVELNVAAAPASVQVRTFTTPNKTVSDIQGFFWANQTFGPTLSSDGRLNGTRVTQTVSCANGACPITVPAPGFALVFLTPESVTNSEVIPEESATFATSARTQVRNTVTVDQAVLATSNGHGGLMQGLGSTSSGSADGGQTSGASGKVVVSVFVAVMAGAISGASLMVR